MGKIIHPEVNCREKKKYLEGKRHSEIMFCKGNAVLSRKKLLLREKYSGRKIGEICW